MPKWLVLTLQDRHLTSPFSFYEFFGSHHASYVYDCYAFVISIMCNEEEPILLEKAQNLENWMGAMQTKLCNGK